MHMCAYHTHTTSKQKTQADHKTVQVVASHYSKGKIVLI